MRRASAVLAPRNFKSLTCAPDFTASRRAIWTCVAWFAPAPPRDRTAIRSKPERALRRRLSVSKSVSTNRVDSGGLEGTREECGSGRMRWDSRTLATKDERHRLFTKCHLPGFESRSAHNEKGGKAVVPYRDGTLRPRRVLDLARVESSCAGEHGQCDRLVVHVCHEGRATRFISLTSAVSLATAAPVASLAQTATRRSAIRRTQTRSAHNRASRSLRRARSAATWIAQSRRPIRSMVRWKRIALLGQPQRRDASAEAGADDDPVVVARVHAGRALSLARAYPFDPEPSPKAAPYRAWR
jgi:hypothetical protein